MTGNLWYQSGLRFQCTGCGGCCTGAPGYVWVNKAEIEALAAALHLEIEAFEKQYVRCVGIRRSLLELANGDCIFLDSEKRTCQVYHVRPRQCRTWPFWPSNLRTEDSWRALAEYCPGANCGQIIPLDKILAQRDMMRI